MMKYSPTLATILVTVEQNTHKKKDNRVLRGPHDDHSRNFLIKVVSLLILNYDYFVELLIVVKELSDTF